MSLLALGTHERAHVLAVDLRCLGDHANLLVRVLLYVLCCAGPDQVQLEVLLAVGWLGAAIGGREVPAVDIVVTEVLDARDGCVECLNNLQRLGGKCSTLGSQYTLLVVDCSQQSNTSAILIYGWLVSDFLIAGCLV